MRMCNQYGNIRKTVTDYADIQHLLNAGWREDVSEEETFEAVEAPSIKIVDEDKLKYKGMYYSWYVQCGTVKQLQAALKHLGVNMDNLKLKRDLQEELRRQIKRIKEEQNDGQ